MKKNIQKILSAGCLLLISFTTVRAAETVSLAGKWRFAIAGTNTEKLPSAFAGKIHLPGTLDDAGLGPKNTKPASLEGPYRLNDYAGPAWYQRDIEIPAGWQNQRVTLFLERCRWVTTVWLDDKRIGSQDSLIAPHIYDFGIKTAPGKHRLTICVDNTVKINLGKFVSALFGGTWGNMNGFIGRIELATTPPVWIDDVQVYPNIEKRTALVKVRIGNASGLSGRGTLKVDGKDSPSAWNTNGGQAEVEVDMSRAKLWDEFAPNLSEVTVKLGTDSRTVRFGMRKFAAKGTQFTLNDRPVYLRGTLECSIWPLTGYPPTDVPAWQRIYRIMKSYGLNHIRFHSWCPPEAAFAAADAEGIMIQAEGPQANVPAGKDAARDAFIEAEFQRMVDTYGNHPSFCTMTLGNEYGGTSELLTRWVDMLIQRDPRHLYSSASSAQTTANRQWTESARGRGIHGADTLRDLREVVANDLRPTIGHEIGQWMYFPDFNEIKKWRGVMALKNFELIRDDLAKKHLLGLAPEYVAASGKFATLLYKEEIEVLLRTPGYGGFSLLDLHDYPTQGTALVGPLDPFWNSKGFVTPEVFRRYCSATVPLLRMPKRTYTSDETFAATADLAHYGPADLAAAQPVWSIKDEQGREVAAGKLPPVNAPTGRLTALGEFKASLANAPAPCKLTVSLGLQGTKIVNDWDIWVYPASGTPPPPPDVVICKKWDSAKAALSAGKKVVFFAGSADTAQSLKGRFLPVFWSPVWFPSQKPNTMGLLLDPKHPLFTQFPTGFYSDWQWYELMQRSRLFILDETPAAYRPTLQVIDNFERNHKLGVIFEGLAGKGRLLVCGIDLTAMPQEPAARQLLASVYAYAGSAAFQPTQKFSGEMLEQLFTPKFANQLQNFGAIIRADNQADEYAVGNAIDGDPKTIWHTPWKEPAPKFPHELVVELPQPVKLSGLTCLPRQDSIRNGWIKDYAVHVSNDGKNWGPPVAQGAFSHDANLKTINFAEPQETKFVKLVALSGFDAAKPFASLAELSVIPCFAGQNQAGTTVATTSAAAATTVTLAAPVILTPKPGPAPRINGPKVYGVRPGSPFLYRIPCTGERPLLFRAGDLPEGLTLDSQSGIITGKITKPGTYHATLFVRNAFGKAAREFRIEAGNTLALTPPMGWNSWYIHYNRVTDAFMRQAADQMIASDMADYGYQYVNIDDCWMKKKNDPPFRAGDGAILPNYNFPDMKGLADYIHGKGLKAGLYTSPGEWTCGGYVGAYQHEAQDARTFAGWGFDFLKYDWCSYNQNFRGGDPRLTNSVSLREAKGLAGYKFPYELMWGELQKQNRDIVFNLCQYGIGDVWKWGGTVGNCWRTTGDLGLASGAALPGFYNIAFKNASHFEYARPGAWNDPDYILIGWVGDAHGYGVGKKTTLTPDEQYSYMSLWSLMAAPLIFSGDMARLDDFTLNVLCNTEVIEVDQDPLGKQAKILRQTSDEFVLVKELEDGSKAVGLFNLASLPRKVSVTWNDLGVSGKPHVRDLWRQKEIGAFDRMFEIEVPAHGVMLVRLHSDK